MADLVDKWSGTGNPTHGTCFLCDKSDYHSFDCPANIFINVSRALGEMRVLSTPQSKEPSFLYRRFVEGEFTKDNDMSSRTIEVNGIKVQIWSTSFRVEGMADAVQVGPNLTDNRVRQLVTAVYSAVEQSARDAAKAKVVKDFAGNISKLLE